MSNSISDKLAEAESHLAHGRFRDAGQYFEHAAEQHENDILRVELLTRAGQAYKSAHSGTDALRCYTRASEDAAPAAKTALLLEIWSLHINEIAGCLYNCGFEWRGDMSGAHDSERAYYQQSIEEHRAQAEQALSDALSSGTMSRAKVIKFAKRTCEDCAQHGWGADICRESLLKVSLES